MCTGYVRQSYPVASQTAVAVELIRSGTSIAWNINYGSMHEIGTARNRKHIESWLHGCASYIGRERCTSQSTHGVRPVDHQLILPATAKDKRQIDTHYAGLEYCIRQLRNMNERNY
jgi:hypothetical protein